MPRKPNKRLPAHPPFASGGRWQSFVPVGGGKRRKASVTMCPSCLVAPSQKCGCYERCADKVLELEDKFAAGTLGAPGRRPTVEKWITTWLTDIAPHQPSGSRREPLRPLTIAGHWSKSRNWVFPHVGGIHLDALEVGDLDALYAAMYKAGCKSSYVRQVHSLLRRALRLAMIRQHIDRNVAEMMDDPGAPTGRKRRALSTDQSGAFMAAIEGEPDELRWLFALETGARQGQALAVRWEYLDLEERVADTSWQIQRRTWKHGCTDPRACGKHVVAVPCPGGAKHDRYHRQGCPKPRGKVCPPRCTGHASKCPKRTGGGIVFCRPKTYRDDDDQHLVKITRSLAARLKAWHTQQTQLRLVAGSLWEEYDLVFTQPTGKPIEPRKDYDRLAKILEKANLPGSGTHILRHTSATTLLDLGVQIEVVQERLGHADIRTTRGYQKVSAKLQEAAADALDAGLYGSATDLATARRNRRVPKKPPPRSA
jgi:integrase